MRRIVLLCLFICLQTPAAHAKTPEAYLGKVEQIYQANPEDIPAILEALSEGLEQFPDDTTLLTTRANFYCASGKIQECRTDVLRLVELKPDLIETHGFLCMLDEYKGADQQANDACYQRVAAMYAAKYNFDPNVLHPQELNYVTMLLMGNHPEAESRKQAFLAKAVNHPYSDLYHEILDNFVRTELLSDILGQK